MEGTLQTTHSSPTSPGQQPKTCARHLKRGDLYPLLPKTWQRSQLGSVLPSEMLLVSLQITVLAPGFAKGTSSASGHLTAREWWQESKKQIFIAWLHASYGKQHWGALPLPADAKYMAAKIRIANWALLLGWVHPNIRQWRQLEEIKRGSFCSFP